MASGLRTSRPARRGTHSRRPSPSSDRTGGRWLAQARSKSASACRAARRPPFTSSAGRTEEGKRQKRRRRTAPPSSTLDDERQRGSRRSPTRAALSSISTLLPFAFLLLPLLLVRCLVLALDACGPFDLLDAALDRADDSAGS